MKKQIVWDCSQCPHCQFDDGYPAMCQFSGVMLINIKGIHPMCALEQAAARFVEIQSCFECGFHKFSNGRSYCRERGIEYDLDDGFLKSCKLPEGR